MVFSDERALSILSTCFLFIFESRTDPNISGLARICIYTIHTLSQERNFAVQLNKMFDGGKYSICAGFLPMFTGTWVDFYILSIYTLITTTSKTQLGSFHEHFLISLSNAAPYFKSVCSISANKMVTLFGLMSSPGLSGVITFSLSLGDGIQLQTLNLFM